MSRSRLYFVLLAIRLGYVEVCRGSEGFPFQESLQYENAYQSRGSHSIRPVGPNVGPMPNEGQI